MKRFYLAILLLFIGSSIVGQDLQRGFQVPPQEARPRVWWHWMDGNVTKDGIRKDLEWMHRVGIGGFHCFEAGVGSEPIVKNRLVYMSPEWKEHFCYAVALADSLGMEVAVASCPGWSNTGGPWVKPEQAMKKLVWTETRIPDRKKKRGDECAHFQISLPEPTATNNWYKDTYVIAIRNNPADKTISTMGTGFSMRDSRQAQTDTIQIRFKKPQTIKALSINDGSRRSIWAAQPAPVTKWLEVSDDGKTYRRICGIPHGSIEWQTIDIPTTTAKFFRIVFDEPPKVTPKLKLYTASRIDHAEEKAGFATPSDLMEHSTPADADAVPLSDVLDITEYMAPDGTLTWRAPKGDWTIYRFGYTLTGKQNHPAPKEATGLEVSKIDGEAFSDFMEYYLNLYKDAAGELMGTRGLHYLLIDSYEAGWETWSPTMAQEFERRRGYSLLPWMPVLTGCIVGGAEQSEKFLFDWRTTIGELIQENMYENAARIAHKHGMETYFEAHENGRLYLADGMSVKCQADIPMAAMWTIPEGAIYDNSSTTMAQSDIRESASVAHLYGKNIVACESMTANGWSGGAYSYYPGNLMPTADLEMASGVNRFVIHESAHQPIDNKRPGLGLMGYGQWFNRHETWAEMAKCWTDYLARSSYMLQQGRNVADILYYYGEDDAITSLFAHQHPAIPAGYNFDYLNKNALFDLITYDGHYFTTPSGARYKIMIISDKCRHFSEPVKQKLEVLRQQGAPIIDESKQSIADALRNIAPDFHADDMADLRFVHRTTDSCEIYWVSNCRNEARTFDAMFRVRGLKPTLWNPETGDVAVVDYEILENETVVHLDMMPWDAFFVVFGNTPVETHGRASLPSSSQIQTITTPWTVHFDPQWGGPDSVVFPHLISYTESDDPGIRYYSGTTVYTNRFEISVNNRVETQCIVSLPQQKIVLDLGNVGCMAQVFVNGREVATLWHAPYCVDITEFAKEGINDLEIRVANLWVNRIIGDQQPDCVKRYTYTPVRFYNADAPLLPSGLMGPVRIIRN